MGDENRPGSAWIKSIPVVADDQIPLVAVQLLVQPLVLVLDGMNDFGDLQNDFWDEQNPFFRVGDAVTFQGNHLELGELCGQQSRYISFSCQTELPTQSKQVIDQGDATGGMPQSPVQWGDQCAWSCYLFGSRN